MSLPSSSSSPSLVVSGCQEFVPSRPGVPIWGTMKCARCSVERRVHVGGVAPFDPSSERRSSSQSSPSNSSTSSFEDSSTPSSSSSAASNSLKNTASNGKRDSAVSPVSPGLINSQKRESGSSFNLNVSTQKRQSGSVNSSSGSTQKRESVNSPIGAEGDIYGTASGRGVGQTNGTASGSLASFIGTALGVKHSGKSSGMTKNRDDSDEDGARSYHQLNQHANQQLAKAIAGLVVKSNDNDNNNKAIGFLHKKASSTSS